MINEPHFFDNPKTEDFLSINIHKFILDKIMNEKITVIIRRICDNFSLNTPEIVFKYFDKNMDGFNDESDEYCIVGKYGNNTLFINNRGIEVLFNEKPNYEIINKIHEVLLHELKHYIDYHFLGINHKTYLKHKDIIEKECDLFAETILKN